MSKTYVLMLPCGAGFPKEELTSKLMEDNFYVINFYCNMRGVNGNKHIDELRWRDLETYVSNTILTLKREDGNAKILLHGWSRGGGVALKLGTTLHSELAGIFTFAATCSPLNVESISCPIVLYHNKNDRTIPYSTSEMTLNRNSCSKLVSDDSVRMGNSHQCNEFVDLVVEKMREFV